MYKRRTTDKQQLVIPKTLVQDIIKESHDRIYAAHPGIRRTHDLVALNYWWPGMRKSIEDYVKKCDPCQRRKEDREFVAPLGEVEEPTAPFQVTSMDITGPYPLTPRKNRFMLTFIDQFSRYVEAFPIPDQTAETCARVYATEIVTRHGSGSKLVTDQGSAFMSAFFQETCKILGIRRINTSAYHPSSNGLAERLHRTLHTGMSHFVNSSNTNWDVVVQFFLMAYRATPNTVTGYSPFYLLHGREMVLPNSSDLKAKVSKKNPTHEQRLENLKASLKLAYKSVARNNRSSHWRNKKLYDRKAKQRRFETEDLVYLYNPAIKPGLSRKFSKPWTGPYKVTVKISDLNYEIIDQKGRKQVVHINRLKRAHDPKFWKPKVANASSEKKPKKAVTPSSEQEEDDIKLGYHPLWNPIQPEENSQPDTFTQTPVTPENAQTPDTPDSECRDPSFEPPTTPRSRRELHPTRVEPPITRARAKVAAQEQANQ